MAGNAKLDLGDKTIELPVIEGSEGGKKKNCTPFVMLHKMGTITL